METSVSELICECVCIGGYSTGITVWLGLLSNSIVVVKGIIIINLINQHIYELGWVCVMGALI